MENQKVSIIVPVYNVEKYLKNCIDSILCQTYNNFEVILVNDGSIDNSGVICNDYAQKDCRVSVFHKLNEGVSVARNFGICEAVGDYICFVDSDDSLVETYVEDFFQNKIFNSDVYFQGYVNVYFDGRSNEVKKFVESNFFKSKEIERAYIYSEMNNICNSPCMKLFRREIIVKYGIEFDKNICYGEDHLFVLNFLLNVDNMSISDKAGYYYFHRDTGSLSKKYVDHDKLFYYSKNVFLMRNEIKKKFFFSNFEFDNYIKTHFTMLVFKVISSLYSKKAKISKSDRKVYVIDYLNYLNTNKLLLDTVFPGVYNNIIKRIISSNVLNKDFFLLVFFRSVSCGLHFIKKLGFKRHVVLND